MTDSELLAAIGLTYGVLCAIYRLRSRAYHHADVIEIEVVEERHDEL